MIPEAMIMGMELLMVACNVNEEKHLQNAMFLFLFSVELAADWSHVWYKLLEFMLYCLVN